MKIFVDSRIGYASSLIDLIRPSTIGFRGWVDRERGKAAARDDGLACFDFDGFKRTGGRSLPAQPAGSELKSSSKRSPCGNLSLPADETPS